MAKLKYTWRPEYDAHLKAHYFGGLNILGREFGGPRSSGRGSNRGNDHSRPQPLLGNLRDRPRSVLPRLQFRGNAIERREPQSNGSALQSRRIEDPRDSHCGTILKKKRH